MGTGNSITISNNIVKNARSYGIKISNGTNINIYNNIVVNSQQGINAGSTTTSSSVIRNNILVGNTFGLSADNGSASIDHDYNLYWNNSGYPGFPEWGSDYFEVNGITAAPHDIHADPLFVNAAGGDYSLTTRFTCNK